MPPQPNGQQSLEQRIDYGLDTFAVGTGAAALTACYAMPWYQSIGTAITYGLGLSASAAPYMTAAVAIVPTVFFGLAIGVLYYSFKKAFKDFFRSDQASQATPQPRPG